MNDENKRRLFTNIVYTLDDFLEDNNCNYFLRFDRKNKYFNF
jgi:hypothetical protein